MTESGPEGRPDPDRVLIAPDRSVAGGAGATVATLGLAALTAALIRDPGLSHAARVVTGGLGALLTLTVAVAAWRLMAWRGGLFLDEVGHRIGLGITGRADIWWLELSRLAGVCVQRTAPVGDDGEFRWRARLELRDGVGVVVAESAQRDLVEMVADQLSDVTGLPLLEDADLAPAPVPVNARVRLGVRRGVALHRTLTLLGASLATVGGALYTQYATAPVFAILFAPVLMALGFALLASVVVKRLCEEELVHQGGLWTHRFVHGSRWRWAERQISAPEPRWTIRILPLRGARLELDGDDSDIIVGNGATTRSRVDVEALVAVPGRFSGAASVTD